jgi:hypothetical protein
VRASQVGVRCLGAVARCASVDKEGAGGAGGDLGGGVVVTASPLPRSPLQKAEAPHLHLRLLGEVRHLARHRATRGHLGVPVEVESGERRRDGGGGSAWYGGRNKGEREQAWKPGPV